MSAQVIGYTCGVFDLFHIGHLNMLRNAKSLCDKLIVGVSTDELTIQKGRKCIIPYDYRAEIVRSICYVDCVIPQNSWDKLDAYGKIKFNKLFVGDDWYGSGKWQHWENELKKNNVDVIYFPYTKCISTTKIVDACACALHK